VDAVMRIVFGPEEVEEKIDWRQLYHGESHTCHFHHGSGHEGPHVALRLKKE
jgi:hypothetical protein